MEAQFGHGFSDVRVHEGALAAEATRSVGAVAYTLGRDLVFAPGAFQPDTPSGLHLLAHELSHVVQQRGAPAVLAPSILVGPAHDPLEQEADRTASAILRGERVSPQQVGIGRVRRLQRAVSKVCNPPSMWFALGGLAGLAAAQSFGALAETFISADVIARKV